MSHPSLQSTPSPDRRVQSSEPQLPSPNNKNNNPNQSEPQNNQSHKIHLRAVPLDLPQHPTPPPSLQNQPREYEPPRHPAELRPVNFFSGTA
jgi:hypothetical protein